MKKFFEIEHHRYILILFAALILQIIGYTMYIDGNGSAIGKTLWYNFGFHDQIAYGIDYYLGVISLFLIAYGFMKKVTWPFYFSFIWLTTMTALTWYQGGSFSAPYSMFAHCNRYLLPALIALWIHSRKQSPDQSQKTVESINVLMIIAIAIVFITHGIEALNKNPIFIDYSLRFIRDYTPIWIDEKHAVTLLLAVGVQDILLGIAILWKPNKWVLGYMAFWGAWTAVLRTLYSPAYGFPSTLIRAANAAIPLVLALQYLNLRGFPAVPKKSAFYYFMDGLRSLRGSRKSKESKELN